MFYPLATELILMQFKAEAEERKNAFLVDWRKFLLNDKRFVFFCPVKLIGYEIVGRKAVVHEKKKTHKKHEQIGIRPETIVFFSLGILSGFLEIDTSKIAGIGPPKCFTGT